MTAAEKQELTVAEVALLFLASLSDEEKRESQQEVNKFVRWYSGGRQIKELTPHEVASYAEGIGSSTTDPLRKLEPIKALLTYAKKERLIPTSLAVHLRMKKTTSSKKAARHRTPGEPVILTSQGYAQLESKLAALKRERPRLAEELNLAAADKDFRENVPLEAARESQGQLEARIRELEATLQHATILSRERDTAKVGLGCAVILRDLASEEEMRYTLVSPNEADPAKGKLSVISPTGRALLDRNAGEVVEVTAPLGTLRYRIEEIER